MAVLAPVLTGIAVAGMGVQAFSAIQEGRSQQKIADQNAEIARRNAALAKEELDYSIRQRKEIGKRKEGIAKAGAYGAGVMPTIDTLANPAVQTKLDIINMQRTANIDIANYLQRSQSLRFEGKQAKKAGLIRGITGFTQAGGVLGTSTMLRTKPAPKKAIK